MIEWLRLTRASGLATVAGNLLAAVAVAVYAQDLDPRTLGRLLFSHGSAPLWAVLSSCFLYLAGMAWNDIADLDRDRILHPRRPLPSERIPLPSAWVGALLLSSLALLTAAPLGGRGVCAAGLVLALALFYDFQAKHWPWAGSLVMALVRAAYALFALLVIGPEYFDRMVGWLLAAGSGRPTGSLHAPVYPLLLLLYVGGVTAVSEFETRAGRRYELLLAGLVLLAAVGLAIVRLLTAHWLGWHLYRDLAFILHLALAGFLFIGLVLVWRIVRPWLKALRSGRRADVAPVVRAALGGMLFFDAVVAASAHPLLGLAVLALFVPYVLTAALLRMD